MSTYSYTRVSDGMPVSETEALDERKVMRPGYRFRSNSISDRGRWMQPGDHIGFDVMMMDAAQPPATRLTLRDAAGVPVTLRDVDTGQSLKLNSDLIAAIEAEAAKLSMTVAAYVKSVLRYSWEQAKLTGATDPNSPSAEERNA